MYRAKCLGRNRVVAFTSALRRELLDRLDLEAELRAAVAAREFVCHYQPQVELGPAPSPTRRRWCAGAIPPAACSPPAAFLDGVERAGFIGAMGEQVMAIGAAQAGAWHRAGRAVAMAVNLASPQLTPALPASVARLADEHGLAPGRLCLEITETALVEAQGEGIGVLRDLAARGVRLSIDDFGTGYSSFAYVRDLPVHEIKLDISFVTPLGRDERDARIVAGMIRLAHDLGLRVVAEGVEKMEQLEVLRGLGCDAAQGFLFARPSADPFAAESRTRWCLPTRPAGRRSVTVARHDRGTRRPARRRHRLRGDPVRPPDGVGPPLSRLPRRVLLPRLRGPPRVGLRGPSALLDRGPRRLARGVRRLDRVAARPAVAGGGGRGAARRPGWRARSAAGRSRGPSPRWPCSPRRPSSASPASTR